MEKETRIKCKKCNKNWIDRMTRISSTSTMDSISKMFYELEHGDHITICGTCRWSSFKVVEGYIPRTQYQQWIDNYCRKNFPL